MDAAHLIWVLFIGSLVVAAVAQDGEHSDDVTPEDLKLLSDYQLKRLADFVKRKGTFSKVSFEELNRAANQGEDSQISDIFGDIPGTQPINDDDQGLGDEGGDDLDPDDPNVVSLMVPPAIQAEMVSTSRPMGRNEHIIVPNILTPPPRLQRPKGTDRSRNHPRTTTPRPIRLRTQTPPSRVPSTTTRALTSEDFELFARVLQEIKKSKPIPTPPPTTPPPIPTTLPPTAPPTPRPFRRQGRPLIVEQQEPEFQEFVVTPLSEKWKGLANELPTRDRSPLVPLAPASAPAAGMPSPVPVSEPATFPISAPVAPALRRNSGNFGLQSIALSPSKIATTPGPSTSVPILEEDELAAVSDIAILRKLFSDYLTNVKNKKDAEGTLPKGSYRVIKGSKTETATPLPLPPSTTVTMAAAVPRASKAYVTILREGFMHDSSETEFTLVATITVIRDAGKVILVDTGLATDINGRTDLIQKLSKLNIAPPMVDIVITTHGHADHSGNTNDFPDSIHYQGEFMHYRTKFSLNKLANANSTQLTQNVKLLRTPGHTSDSVSVVVSNTDQYGTVAIVGDTFFSEKDLDFPILWKRFATDPRQQDDSRRKLICEANFIVPGHGKAFQVTASMKHGANCGTERTAHNNILRHHRTRFFERK